MHEHAMIAGLLRRVGDIAAAEKAQRVVKVSVWLGALSNMSPAHFAEHFAEEAAGSIAEGAELDCATSDDIRDPRAMDVVITSIEVEA
jgi:hydrogenase nickel incorporation protein HypA/HybF